MGFFDPSSHVPDRVRRSWAWFVRRPWHHRVAIVLGILIVLAVIVGATFRIVPSGGDELDIGGSRSEPPDDVRAELAQRFAPILKLDSKELFVPIDLASYVSTTNLDERVGKKLFVLQDSPTPATLPEVESPCVRAQGCTYVLDVRGAEPPRAAAAYGKIDDELLKHGARLTVYAHVLRYDASGDYGIQYWFLYLYNYRLNEHESDWEQITVGLDKDQTPKKVFYSSHATGFTRDWNDIEHDNDHPVVYVALGSHANYFHAGEHVVTLACNTFHFHICISNTTIHDISDGRGLQLQPANYQLRQLTTPLYIGSYGTGNYIHGIRQNEILNDPRWRPAWNNPLGRLEKGKPL